MLKSFKWAFLLVLLTANVLSAATYYVAANGNDSNNGSAASPWAAIYTSIPKLNSGDTLLVLPGSYISGTQSSYTFAGNNITITGSNAVVIQVVAQTASTGQRGEWIFTGNNVNLSGFKFTSGITNSPGATSFGFNGTVIELDGSQNFIHDCVISNFAAQLVVNSGFDPFLLFTGSSSSLDVISNLTVNSIYDFDILEGWGISNVLENCNVYHCYNSNYNYGGSSQLHADFFQTFGIVSGMICEYYTIKNCYLHDSEIDVGNTETDGNSAIHDLYFYNDIFANVGNPLFSGIPGTKFYNCVFDNVGVNVGEVIYWYNENDSGNQRSSTNCAVENCVFVNSPWGMGVINVNNPIPILLLSNIAQIDNYSGASPGFVNESAANYHLAAGSPLIGAGTNLFSVFTTDAAGLTRPSSGMWDIGAYAYTTNNGNLTPPPTPSGLKVL